MNLQPFFLRTVFIVYFAVLSVLLIFSLLRSIKGPRFTDRIVAVNVIGTVSTAAICIISIYVDEGFFVDIALVYALLNFLSVVILSHVVTVEHNKKEKNKKQIAGRMKNDNTCRFSVFMSFIRRFCFFSMCFRTF